MNHRHRLAKRQEYKRVKNHICSMLFVPGIDLNDIEAQLKKLQILVTELKESEGHK